MQAQDRAFRIGQRQDVHVYRFVSSNTVEEKVHHTCISVHVYVFVFAYPCMHM